MIFDIFILVVIIGGTFYITVRDFNKYFKGGKYGKG